MWRQDRHGDFEEPVKAASAEPAGAAARRERELHAPCKKTQERNLKEFVFTLMKYILAGCHSFICHRTLTAASSDWNQATERKKKRKRKKES